MEQSTLRFNGEKKLCHKNTEYSGGIKNNNKVFKLLVYIRLCSLTVVDVTLRHMNRKCIIVLRKCDTKTNRPILVLIFPSHTQN